MKRLFTVFASLLTQGAKEQKTKMMYVVMTSVMMMLAPSSVKGQTTTIDFQGAALAAYNAANDPGNGKYNCTVTMGEDYSPIGNGAKKGVIINWKNSNTSSTDISRVAFLHNTNGVGNARNTGAGFYLRREKNSVDIRGLFTGSWNNRIAVLNLNIGDKVTFYGSASNEAGTTQNYGIKYIQSVHANTGGDDIYNNGNAWVNSNTINITSKGDLIVQPNCDVYITSIVIEPAPRATYLISESADKKTSTFEFEGDGVLDDNDFAILNTSLSFGSTTDYLVVNDLESHMIKANGTETLETDANHDFQPSAGCFYTFRPTATGYIDLYGTLQGNAMHVFVYKEGWIDRANNNVFYSLSFGSNDISKTSPYTFHVDKGKTYYVCINNTDNNEHSYALHVTKVVFRTEYFVDKLGVVVNNVDDFADTGYPISLTALSPAGGYHLSVKRCSANIEPSSLNAQIQNGWLYMSKPRFVDGADHAGTVIWNLDAEGGSDAIVVTFPYHASYNPTGYDSSVRSYGHTWNFIDPRNSDSNIGNSLENNGYGSWVNGTTTGILSIGQADDVNSQFYDEVQKREWVYAQRQTGQAGGFHDPYYVNVWDMVGDNADMIWETEGLWFDTGTNLSCIYNEKDAYDQSLTNPVDFATLGTDPDRYVGLLPVTDGKKSSFTIPGLMPGDRVLIFMKSGESSGDNGIFLNITGAKDALGKPIVSTDLYKAGGTNWQHSRYEGCYHFIKDDTTDEGSEYGRITFDMKAGSMCKLLYIHIYQGQRINTNSIVSSATGDSGRLLFMNEKGAELGSDGQGSNMTLRFRGKGQQQKAKVLTCSGNLNYQLSIGKNHKQDVLDDHFTVTGAYYQSVGFTSKVGEIGMFRLREMDVEYSENYVADFSDRNFTVGYRDKVDSYPYTWDFTDIKGFSQAALTNEANNYPIAAAANDEYGDQWEISLFDSNGYMQLNSGFDPITNNQIFSPHKIGNGNQLWAGAGVIPEAKGLWFYSEDDEDDGYTTDYCSSLYNGCMQITTEGIRFANVPDDAGKRVAWWNYKMVVPDVPADGAVYMRMKRDTSVPDNAVTYSEKDNADVPFLAARFKFASQGSKTDMVTGGEITNGESYSFFQVPGTTDEWIVAVKNTTGAVNHLTFTLNGWIVEKVAVSTDYKTIGKTGYATESRARVIDQRLTSYFTGLPVKAYKGKMNSDYSILALTEIDIMDKDNDPGNPADAPHIGKGCILYNSLGDKTEGEEETTNEGESTNETPDKSVKVLDNGFHLFVPDMHLKDETTKNSTGANNSYTIDLSNNELKSCVPKLDGVSSTGTGADGSTPVTRFILSAKAYRFDDASKTLINDGKVGFYRMDPNGVNMKGNQAYIEIPTSVLPELYSSTTNQGKVSIIFGDFFEEVNHGITTAVENIDVQKLIMDGSAEWYNLNGQKLNGKPTSSGLYIINGKKVLVK